MIDHTGVPTKDWAKAKAFYNAAFGALGGGLMMEVPLEYTEGKHVAGYGRDRPVFWVHEDDGAAGARHIALTARSHAEVDAFYQAAMAAGGRDNGKPGPRPQYHPDYYAAFVLDPDGNNIEAVCRLPEAGK